MIRDLTKDEQKAAVALLKNFSQDGCAYNFSALCDEGRAIRSDGRFRCFACEARDFVKKVTYLGP